MFYEHKISQLHRYLKTSEVPAETDASSSLKKDTFFSESSVRRQISVGFPEKMIQCPVNNKLGIINMTDLLDLQYRLPLDL